jgi:hypothetical protein
MNQQQPPSNSTPPPPQMLINHALPHSYRGDWACPECVHVAETALEMDHLSPAQALRAHTARLHADAMDVVQSEQDDGVGTEPSPKHSLKWLRWRIGKEPDFLNEENMVSQLIHQRGHLYLFLPKFHCDLNWAENHWLGQGQAFCSKTMRWDLAGYVSRHLACVWRGQYQR